MDLTHPSVGYQSSPEAKITLFRSLFRGREDVFPRRFESAKTGKSGYQPACENEWVRDLCNKRSVRCAECPHRRFIPVTDDLIRRHLSGQDENGRDFVMGMYPMRQDETCFFLAIDFDKKAWIEDVRAVRETCVRLNLPAALERSRSGQGGHLWFFFDEALPASLARRLGAHLLTETMEHRPDLGLDSYDRMFPNQDTLPGGGFGNLIALPLQKRAREHGNSVFLDERLEPHEDQWAYLSSIRKLGLAEVEALVSDAEHRDRIVGVRLSGIDEEEETPWTTPPSRRREPPPILGPFPESLELVLGNQIYVPKAELPPALLNRLHRLAAFQNPEFYKAQAMRLPTYGKPRVIACAEDYPQHLGLPRGCLEEVGELLSRLQIPFSVRDERNGGRPLAVSFQGELRPGQTHAVEALLSHDTGVLAATTAFGKTVAAAALIARRGVNTLVLVHRSQLLEQWVQRLSDFLGLPPKAIGAVGGGRRKTTGKIDVALIQSLVRKGVVHDLVGEYGHLVVDECHHLSAHSFEQVARRSTARFVTGLSATVTRKDGHHPIIHMQCGPVRYRADARTQAAGRPFSHSVYVRPTGFLPSKPADPDARIRFQALYDDLIADEARNRLICADVARAIKEGRSPLVLTERTEHLEHLAQRLSPSVRHLVVLRGGMGRKELKTTLAQLASIPDTEERVLIATGRFIGEGFDDARLDTLFLTLPVSWRGTIAQYAGRLHRLHDRKREVRVYDYADLDVPMLARMFDRRCRGYEAIGYTIQLPASAVPGWPADVPLPVDPEWKKDFAASVRRLIRDGVDVPLANLFVWAAGEFTPDAEGADRARSASEAFLFRRLETLQEMAGRFRLNTELPIAFDGRGAMEVDLLCQDGRVAIEVDGGQHLGNPDAYRRDRRKDALLQENGYFVLRFLTEDLSKHLDEVLDAISRALFHQSAKR